MCDIIDQLPLLFKEVYCFQNVHALASESFVTRIHVSYSTIAKRDAMATVTRNLLCLNANRVYNLMQNSKSVTFQKMLMNADGMSMVGEEEHVQLQGIIQYQPMVTVPNIMNAYVTVFEGYRSPLRNVLLGTYLVRSKECVFPDPNVMIMTTII